jgi:4'-phosphopantetheinyl transferase
MTHAKRITARAQVVYVEGHRWNDAGWLGDPDRLRVAASVLDEDEAGRLRGLRTTELRLAYLVSRLALRSVLAERLNVSTSELTFSRQPCSVCGAAHGKPVLVAPGACEFSLSRTSGGILIGVSDVPIGVDIESVADGADAAGDVGHLLHADERQELTGANDPEPGRTVLQLWCRKEAYLKGTGEGLTRPLNTHYLGHDRSRRPPGWAIVDGPENNRFVSAIAVNAADAELSWDVVPLSQILNRG